MKHGLTAEVYKKAKDALGQFPQVDEVILYGSRAMGTQKPGSDIDLTLKGKGLTQKTLNQIRTALDDLLLPYTFDISLFDEIDNADLIDHIRRVGKKF